MVEIKSDEALDAMREAGRVVAGCLAAARETAAVGVRLIELDQAAHVRLDAYPRLRAQVASGGGRTVIPHAA